MRKNSREYIEWIKRKNTKKLIQRTRKKEKKKRLLTSVIKHDISIKNEKNYDIKEDRTVFTAPSIFSFIENPEETNEFFINILRFISVKRNYRKNIFIDISTISKLTTDALMYLLAIINNLNENFRNSYRISGNNPMNPNANKLFEESGFYRFVRRRDSRAIVQNKDNLQILAGDKCDYSAAKRVCDFVTEKSGIDNKRKCSFLYEIITELMSNTKNHAYNKNDVMLYPNWYCFAQYDGINTIKFIFMDTGEGIPSTILKRFLEKIDVLGIKSESDYVISALNSQFRTSTELKHRGKGLPRIRKHCLDSKIDNMTIITNKANVRVTNKDLQGEDLINSLQGTLFSWDIDINKI